MPADAQVGMSGENAGANKKDRRLGAWEDRDSLYLKTDMFSAIGKLRLEAWREIDRLVRFLDLTDDHQRVGVDHGCGDP
jgi:hypothetical protein